MPSGLRFEEEKCIGCGLCEKNCPCGAIRMEDKHPVFDPGRCIECFMCASKCPKSAIHDEHGFF